MYLSLSASSNLEGWNWPLENKTMANKKNSPLKLILMSIKPGEESNYCFLFHFIG